MQRLRVLLTGASGAIGRHVAPALRERHQLRTLDAQANPGDPPHVVANLTDIAALRAAMTGIEVVVHLAAVSHEADFHSELLPNNLAGLANTLDAASQAGVRRVVFASTAQTVARYPVGYCIQPGDPDRPCSIYATTKIFGEALGRFYHEQHGLEFVAIRIGWFTGYDDPRLRTESALRAIWLSPGDAVRLLQCAIEKPDVGYVLAYGTSRTDYERLPLQSAREQLGYEPADDVATFGGPRPTK